jgi:uncharacterized membrane protein YfcA
MLGAVLAGRVAHRVPAPLLLAAFSVMMLATALAMLRPERSARDQGGPVGRRRERPLPISKILAEGLVVGAATGLVGAGGGFLVVPALVLLGRLPMATAVGTSLLVIALGSFAGFASHVGYTAINWSLALGVSAFSVLGSLGGTRLAARLSAQTLRQAFGWFVVAMAFFILAREGPPIVGIEPSLGVAALSSLAGTALVALVRRLLACRRSPRGGAPPETKPGVAAAALHSKLERKRT